MLGMNSVLALIFKLFTGLAGKTGKGCQNQYRDNHTCKNVSENAAVSVTEELAHQEVAKELTAQGNEYGG